MTSWGSFLFIPLVGQVALATVAAVDNLIPGGQPEGWVLVIGQFGIAGVLAFILAKLIPYLKGMEDRLHDRLREVSDSNQTLARSNFLMVMALKQADASTREAARGEYRKIQRNNPRREEEPDT